MKDVVICFFTDTLFMGKSVFNMTFHTGSCLGPCTCMVLTLKTAHIPDKVLPTTWELLFRSSHRQSGFPGGASGKNPPASTGDIRDRFNLGLGRSPAEGRGNPLQYSCLENLVDRRAWWATVHGVPGSQTQLK